MKNTPWYIYFIYEDGNDFVKIGYSKNPHRRRFECQIGNHRKLVLHGHLGPFHTLESVREEERFLHKKYNCVGGEWYEIRKQNLPECVILDSPISEQSWDQTYDVAWVEKMRPHVDSLCESHRQG